MTEPFWTNDKAKALNAIMTQPIMVDFMAELKERTRVRGVVAALDPGYDALVLAAAAFNHAAGQSSVIDIIEGMRADKKQTKSLDPDQMFQPPAR